MNHNIFNTQEEADTAQEYDFQKYKNFINDHDHNYWNNTTAWAKPYSRATDNKWVYVYCPQSDAVHTTEEYDESWIAA